MDNIYIRANNVNEKRLDVIIKGGVSDSEEYMHVGLYIYSLNN